MSTPEIYTGGPRPGAEGSALRGRLLRLFLGVTVVSGVALAIVIAKLMWSFDALDDTMRTMSRQIEDSRRTFRLSAQRVVKMDLKNRAESLGNEVAILYRTNPAVFRSGPDQDPDLRRIFLQPQFGAGSQVALLDAGGGRVVLHRDYISGEPIDDTMPEWVTLLNARAQAGAGAAAAGGQNFELLEAPLVGPIVHAQQTYAAEFRHEAPDGSRARIFAAISPVAGTKWVLAVKAPLEPYYAREVDAALSRIASEKETASAFNEETNKVRSSSSLAIAIWILAVIAFFFAFNSYADRYIIEPIQHLAMTAEMISQGKYDVRADVRTGGELGHLGETLNRMLDVIVGLIESEADKRKLQDNIVNLLEMVSKASEGILTARGAVTDDELGSVTDALNLMLESIGRLILEVRATADDVARACGSLRSSSREMAEGAARQASEIQDVKTKAQMMRGSMQRAAENASLAAAAVQRLNTTARKGTEAVVANTMAMERISHQVQKSSKRIKGLGERSLEINTIVELIQDIATQTNMLALNASIEASRAGEAGMGFAVVAEEVRKLADRVSLATRDIAEYIEGIQNDAVEAAKAMDEVTREVEAGNRLASQVGGALQEIAKVAESSSEQTSEISRDAAGQVDGMQRLAGAMEAIYQITRETAEGSVRSQQIALDLTKLSENLLANIKRFKVSSEAEELAATDFAAFREQLNRSLEQLAELNGAGAPAGDQAGEIEHTVEYLEAALSVARHALERGGVRPAAAAAPERGETAPEPTMELPRMTGNG